MLYDGYFLRWFRQRDYDLISLSFCHGVSSFRLVLYFCASVAIICNIGTFVNAFSVLLLHFVSLLLDLLLFEFYNES